MNILIFNPDEKEARKLERQIKTLGEGTEKQLKTYCFTDLKRALRAKTNFDIALIETDTEKNDGAALGKALKNKFPYLKLLYIANSYDSLDECIDIGAVRYLVRPFSEGRLKSGIIEAVRRLEEETVAINLKGSFETYRIIIKDIIFVEIVNRKTKLVTVNGTYLSKHSLTYWRERLSDFGFVSTHISFIVNLNCITQYRRNKLVVLNNKYEIPISRSRCSEFHKCYMDYISITERKTAGD